MQCGKCGYNNKDWAKVCNSCGKNFIVEKKVVEQEKNIQPTQKSFYPHTKAMKALNNLYLVKKEITKKIYITYICVILLIIVCLSDNLIKYSNTILTISVVLFVVSMMACFMFNIINATNYYSIPTSKDKNHKHRCIFCGDDKINKSYILKSSISMNHCDKCNQFLYYKLY